MIRRRRTLRIVVLAVSLSAVASAPAAAAEFRAASAPVTLTAVQTTLTVFTTDAVGFPCKSAHYVGTMASAKASEVKLAFNIDQCSTPFYGGMPFHENGCSYRFTASGQVHLECPVGKEIEITGLGPCLLKIPAQMLSGVTYTNNSSQSAITVTAKFTNMTYYECGTKRTNGTTSGTYTLTASASGGGPVSVWYE
jgi:hypothetical protein